MERTWKLEQNPGGGPQQFALAGYEKSGHRAMEATKVLEGLSQKDLRDIVAVIHKYFHSED
jgi:hypothetical protein